MELIDILLIVIHVAMAAMLIVAILLQSGKGGGLGAGFGGASAAATQIFGGRGAGNFLSRSTVVFAAVFMSTSLGLAVRSAKPRTSLDLDSNAGEVSSQEDTILEEGTLPSIGDAKEEPKKVEEPVVEDPKPNNGTNNAATGSNNGTTGSLKLKNPLDTVKSKIGSDGGGASAVGKSAVANEKAPKKPLLKKVAEEKKADSPEEPQGVVPGTKVKESPKKLADEKVQDPKEPSAKEMPKDSAP